jgi:nucleotide-binding universal stress UspA family protein
MPRRVAPVMLRLQDIEQPDMIVGLGARHLDGTAGLADDVLGDRAEHQPLDAGEPLAADDDQIRADLARQVQDLAGGMADPHVNEEVHPVGDRRTLELRRDLVEQRALDALHVGEIDPPVVRQRRDLAVRLDRAHEVEDMERGSIRDRDRAVHGRSCAVREIEADDDLAVLGVHMRGTSKRRTTPGARSADASDRREADIAGALAACDAPQALRLASARAQRLRVKCGAGRVVTTALHGIQEDQKSYGRHGPLREFPRVMSIPHQILVPIDFDDSTAQVLDYAVALAARLDAKVHVLHVVPWPLLGAEVPVGVTEAAMHELIANEQKAFDELVAAHTRKEMLGSAVLKTHDARAAIIATAEEIPADLIVMGTHGRRGVPRLVLGSVAESVVRTAPCPVLLVRSGTRIAPDR